MLLIISKNYGFIEYYAVRAEIVHQILTMIASVKVLFKTINIFLAATAAQEVHLSLRVCVRGQLVCLKVKAFPCNLTTLQLCNSATLQHRNFATLQLCNFATL